MKDTELYHWGIKGMKWGVRRYQYKDGSLTPAGKLRYADDNSSASDSPAKKAKSVREMSDDELRDVVNRLRLEQAYGQLNPKKVSTGKKIADKILKDIVVPAATEVGRNALKQAMQSAVDSAIKKKK